ncbi:hypothetical protein EDC96DRAFT_549775 [Choanephora cucurbitarum]|nr:hypothetical protein EDC96DRAFT_549775 [Choanephora cucurbitarum]
MLLAPLTCAMLIAPAKMGVEYSARIYVEIKVKDDRAEYTVTTYNPTLGLRLLKQMTDDSKAQMVIEGKLYLRAWVDINGVAAMTKKVTLTSLTLLKHVLDKFYDDEEELERIESLMHNCIRRFVSLCFPHLGPTIPIKDVKFSTEEIKARRETQMQEKRCVTSEIANLLKEKILQTNTVSLLTDADIRLATKKRKIPGDDDEVKKSDEKIGEDDNDVGIRNKLNVFSYKFCESLK